MTKIKDSALVPVERITHSILRLRNHKVILDADLAALYGVATKLLLQAVKRNLERFPEDFLLQLTAEEWLALRSQIVTSNAQRGGRRYVYHNRQPARWRILSCGLVRVRDVLGSSARPVRLEMSASVERSE